MSRKKLYRNLNKKLQSKRVRRTFSYYRLQELVSHHTFMLPFKWTPKERDGFISHEEFDEVVEHYLKSDDWTSESFNLDRVVDYNEFHYFYDYVREALYDYVEGSYPKNQHEKENKKFIRHLSYSKAAGGKYYIQTPIPAAQRDSKFPHDDGRTDPAFRKTYELEIDSVLLHLYYTGVGVLSFHLHNRRADQAAPDDILYINQYGRRVFPPFYRVSHWKAGHQVGFDSEDFTILGRPHGGEIAYEIGLQLPGTNERITEKWEDSPKSMLRDESTLTFRLAAFIEPFLGKLYAYPQPNDPREKIGKTKEPLDPGNYKIQSVLDDRMFVVCWYGNKAITDRLAAKQIHKRKRANNGQYRRVKVKGTEADRVETVYTDDWLYKFIFVDAGQLTVQNPALRRELLNKAAYQRWSGYGSYYGITDYSFVLLTAELPELRQPWVNASFLVTHLQTIYFRLCELVLIQRASIQRFSDEVTHVSQLDIPKANHEKFDEKVNQLSAYSNELYQRYIRFVNRVYFREVTAQIQGVELYERLHQQARLPTMVEGLKEEIHELHNYVAQETGRQLLAVEKDRKATEEERTNFLTLIGALFLAPALLVAIYDMGFYGDCLKTYPNVFYALTILAATLTAVIFYLTFVMPQSDEVSVKELKVGKVRRQKRLPYAVGIYLVLLFSPMIYGLCYCPALTIETGEIKSEPPMVPEDSNIAPTTSINSTSNTRDSQITREIDKPIDRGDSAKQEPIKK